MGEKDKIRQGLLQFNLQQPIAFTTEVIITNSCATEIFWKTENSGRFGGAAAPPCLIRSSDICGVRMNFCEAELALRKQKFFPCAFAARESQRDDRQRRGGSRKGDWSPLRGLCSSPFSPGLPCRPDEGSRCGRRDRDRVKGFPFPGLRSSSGGAHGGYGYPP